MACVSKNKNWYHGTIKKLPNLSKTKLVTGVYREGAMMKTCNVRCGARGRDGGLEES